ncbi:Sensory box protein/GGDEF family protein (modular protein) [Pseudomonas sp. JV551A1]|uniref:Sensory box protein/GGDEF family protein (Modular protein) n=1 Tax=Pseudomonas inefficax TaxID=2078786 RepID=A0AAQ1P8U2_9PSED|nr:Sensory box protein/GGDEF family protein (modular protein) [Pseudomonas sp. JV551A1]SPO59734.1 Sensory box protein/GGDEF family protein (modular protein) [Pseudomonas inefficax]
MGAGLPAITGEAGAIHRVACFAGTPAPTGPASGLRHALYLWELACRRSPAKPVPSAELPVSRVNPLPPFNLYQIPWNLPPNHSGLV